MSDDGHEHDIDLLTLDKAVMRLRNTAANYSTDCQALIEVIDDLPDDSLCEVLSVGFSDLRGAICTMEETMRVLGGNMMDYLNAIASHIAQTNLLRKLEEARRQQQENDPQDPQDPTVH